MAKATSGNPATKKSVTKTQSKTSNETQQTPKSVVRAKLANATSGTTDSAREISTEDRNRMIQYAAYHIAEKDGFQSGREQDYWFQAEKQITDLFSNSTSSSH